MTSAGPPKRRQYLIAADAIMHSFRIGDRIRLSRLGEMRNPRKSPKVGTLVSVKLHKSGPSSVLVLFDGRKEPSRLHWTYVEQIDHSARGHG
jgi:hypothetical protein